MEGCVYLITELDNEKYYKIGMTKKKNIDERMKELQTGNASELFIISHFKSKFPSRVESILHKQYSHKNKINEWYELTEDEVKNFKDNCALIERNLEIADKLEREIKNPLERYEDEFDF